MFCFRTQVGEDDYHQLKHDQCLRVDFKSFPTKFIELLESCRATTGGGAADPDARDGGAPGEGGGGGGGRAARAEPLSPGGSGEPSFLARLETVAPGGFSVFSVVETNPFKELTHLSLKFRAGNDAAIKTYLAARLRQVGRVVFFLFFFYGFAHCFSLSWRVYACMRVAFRALLQYGGCCFSSRQGAFRSPRGTLFSIKATPWARSLLCPAPSVGAGLSPLVARVELTPCVYAPACLCLLHAADLSTQLKAEVLSTSSTLEDARTALAGEGAARSRLDTEVSALLLDRERDLRDLRAAHSAELTAAREDGVRRAEEAAAARSSEVCR